MWKLRRKKSASGADELAFPGEKEFWLVRGAFREWQADRSGQGYYGLCGCSAEAVCPPGERPYQGRFYRLVYGLTERMLQSAPSMVLVEDLSRSDVWERQKTRFKQLALDSGGAVLKKWASGRTAVRSCFLKCRVRSCGTFTDGWRSMGAGRSFTCSTVCWSIWPRRRPSPHSKKRRA